MDDPERYAVPCRCLASYAVVFKSMKFGAIVCRKCETRQFSTHRCRLASPQLSDCPLIAIKSGMDNTGLITLHCLIGCRSSCLL